MDQNGENSCINKVFLEKDCEVVLLEKVMLSLYITCCYVVWYDI
jgi:hypothetical protein